MCRARQPLGRHVAHAEPHRCRETPHGRYVAWPARICHAAHMAWVCREVPCRWHIASAFGEMPCGSSIAWAYKRDATRAAQHRRLWHRVPWGRAQFFGVVYTAPPIYQAFHADSNVSKQDTHFFNTFSVVIGLLIVIAIGIFALARVVASETQDKQVLEEAQYLKSVDSHLQPVAKEAVAGADNTALAIKPDAGSEGAAGSASGGPAAPKDGGETFTQVCSACHGAGIAGAPKAGDKAAWGPRIAKGKDVLYDHALKGFQGSAGVMPAKGGRADLSDDLVKAAVDHMVDRAK